MCIVYVRLVSGRTVTAKVAPGGFWLVATPSLRVVASNQTSGESLCRGKCFAMVDSGSSFLGVPRELYPRTVQALTRSLLTQLGSGACTPLGSGDAADPWALLACRCGSGDVLWYPSIEFEVAGESLTLAPSDYLQPLPKRGKEAWCFLGVRPADHPAAEATTFILGSSFLKACLLAAFPYLLHLRPYLSHVAPFCQAFCTHFDLRSRRISFTRTAHSRAGHSLNFENSNNGESSSVSSPAAPAAAAITLRVGEVAATLLLVVVIVAWVLGRWGKSSARGSAVYELAEVEMRDISGGVSEAG